MERSDVQNRKQHYPSGIQNTFDNLKNRDSKADVYIHRNLEGSNVDSCLYKSKSAKGIQNVFNNLKNRDNKVDFDRHRNLEDLTGDCCLHKSKPAKIPEKYVLLAADIPNLLENKADVHYQGKYYDELVKIDPEYANDSKMFEDRWNFDEIRHFETACKLLHGRHKNKSKIDYLTEKLPHKTVKELIQHYYIFHQPNFKKKK